MGQGRGRFVIALVLAIFSLLSYFGYREYNPITAETQHIRIQPEDEIALGLQAAPELAAQYGGPSSNQRGQAQVEAVGQRLVSNTVVRESPYRFQFHLLDDDKTINAFALPGGQVFITDALFNRLEHESELAGVLGHEVGHVVARHGAEHLAKQQLMQGLGGAAVIASSDPDRPGASQRNAMLAMAVGQLINMRFGRDDELESDRLGVRFMSEAAYDPRGLISLMKILAASSEGKGRPPEFFSTHPNPERRVEQLKAVIQERFPNGLPEGLKQ
jgi:beta-barrel assembly-enhancing protease